MTINFWADLITRKQVRAKRCAESARYFLAHGELKRATYWQNESANEYAIMRKMRDNLCARYVLAS